jgi:anion-transporting  ArsA/GET3 family ATPase
VHGLLERDLVVVTAKGGVGKTTVAAALALAGARRGRRVVLAEVGGRSDAVRLLAGSGVDHLSITPRDAMEEYLRTQLPRTVAELLSRSGTFAAFVEATPGMNELLTVGKVWELAAERRRTPGADPYDLVVLDAPASGHGLALLGAPRTFSQAARVGPIHRQAGIIAATLGDAQLTAVVAVTLPEEMPVNETLELRAALRERMGLDLSLVVANEIVADRFSSAEAKELAALHAPPGSPVAAALWGHARARAQRNQLRRLRAGLDEAPARLAFVAETEIGPQDVADMADQLGRRL